MKKTLFIIAGSGALGLASVGVVVPGIPTTPLVLLAAYCFAKGSERVHNWLMHTWIYKKYIAEYVRTKGMTKKAKRRILILATTMMVISCIAIPNIYVRIILVLLMCCMHYYFYARIKTIAR